VRPTSTLSITPAGDARARLGALSSRLRHERKSTTVETCIMRLTPQLTYSVIGFCLGLGAPVGSFLLRLMFLPNVRAAPWAELRANAFFYGYELLATSLAFAIAGLFAGVRARRLRQGEAFYHELAEHDALTGLHNERAFRDRYQRALERAVTARQPLSLILIDVDELKAINDEWGHPVGSEALMHVAGALVRNKRAADVAARWGGDEFAILLEGADLASATRVGNAILADLRSSALQVQNAEIVVTVTVGICTALRPNTGSDLFKAADRALLAGKANGRNTLETVTLQ
jgi:diguanylate cyclase (GGDEF)-like protein